MVAVVDIWVEIPCPRIDFPTSLDISICLCRLYSKESCQLFVNNGSRFRDCIVLIMLSYVVHLYGDMLLIYIYIDACV